MSKQSLIAAIDVGTNSLHMLIASVTHKGMYKVHSHAKETVRLGEGAGDMKYLSDEAIERGVSAMRRFAAMAERENAQVRAVATSAVREAANQREFIDRVHDETGIGIEVVSGSEEGRLIYLGVVQALPVVNKRILTIDIGGGSTETVVGYRGEMEYVHSAKLGAIRLTQKFGLNKLPTKKKIDECRAYIRGEWSAVFDTLRTYTVEEWVGCSGTIQTLVAMALARQQSSLPESLNGVEVPSDDILAAVHTLLQAGESKKRADLPGVDAKRADIIVGGALILEQAIQNLAIPKLTFSGYALREGLLFDTIAKQRAIKKYHHLSSLRYESVLHLCETAGVSLEHSKRVTYFASALFDGMRELHGYGDVERELLEAAAMLHDVGYHISPEQHHKHSYYIIRNSPLLGFTNDESELIANIARYHRKSHPKLKHDNFSRLGSRQRRLVRILSGMLRLAEACDRSLRGNVADLLVKVEGREMSVVMRWRDNYPDVELWRAAERKQLLEEALLLSITITAERHS